MSNGPGQPLTEATAFCDEQPWTSVRSEIGPYQELTFVEL